MNKAKKEKIEKFKRYIEHTPMGQELERYDVNFTIICKKIEEIIERLIYE